MIQITNHELTLTANEYEYTRINKGKVEVKVEGVRGTIGNGPFVSLVEKSDFFIFFLPAEGSRGIFCGAEGAEKNNK